MIFMRYEILKGFAIKCVNDSLVIHDGLVTHDDLVTPEMFWTDVKSRNMKWLISQEMEREKISFSIEEKCRYKTKKKNAVIKQS